MSDPCCVSWTSEFVPHGSPVTDASFPHVRVESESIARLYVGR